MLAVIKAAKDTAAARGISMEEQTETWPRIPYWPGPLIITVGSKKCWHGYRLMYAGISSSRGLGLEDCQFQLSGFYGTACAGVLRIARR